MTANVMNTAWSVAAIIGSALCLVLGVMWLVLLLRTRAKLKAIEDSTDRKKTKRDSPGV